MKRRKGNGEGQVWCISADDRARDCAERWRRRSDEWSGTSLEGLRLCEVDTTDSSDSNEVTSPASTLGDERRWDGETVREQLR